MRDLCIKIKVLKSEFKRYTGDFSFKCFRICFLQTSESFKPFKGISTLIFLCTIDVLEHHLFNLDNAIKILANARCIMHRLYAEFGKWGILFKAIGKRKQPKELTEKNEIVKKMKGFGIQR